MGSSLFPWNPYRGMRWGLFMEPDAIGFLTKEQGGGHGVSSMLGPTFFDEMRKEELLGLPHNVTFPESRRN